MNKISALTACAWISAFLIVIASNGFLGKILTDLTHDKTNPLLHLNQSDIHYMDTHRSSLAALYVDEILNDDKIKASFSGGGTYILRTEPELVRVPPFEFTKIMEKGDVVVSKCREYGDERTIWIAHFRDIVNNTVYFDHYTGEFTSKDGDCIYPDIIKQSFNFNWNFPKVSLSDIYEIPFT